MSDKRKDKGKKKKKNSVMEAEIMRFMEKSMKTALDLALDDIFKDWRDRRKFCVIDNPRQYENLRLSQE